VLYAGDPAGQVCGTWWDCICYNLERIAAALERIANVLEQQ
jgi:hypothetical protein